MVTEDLFRKAFPRNPNPGDWVDAMRMLLPYHKITTKERIAAFLAQCGHESAGFTRIEENLNYSTDGLLITFRKHFPTRLLAATYARDQEAIANRVYANRMGNGPERSGDGWRFRGRGCIQITGRDNYTALAHDLGLSLDTVTSYLRTTTGALESACWYWKRHDLYDLDFITMTRKINGGLNGLEDRQQKFEQISNLLLTA